MALEAGKAYHSLVFYRYHRRMIRFLLILLCCCFQIGYAQITYQQVYVDYDGSWTYQNLRVIPVRPKSLPGAKSDTSLLTRAVSMEEAMKNGWITVQERGSSSTENVHWLSVYNHSNKPILFRSGALLEGGRQDRMVTKDTVMLPGVSRIDLPVMCVEEGRWSEKTKKFLFKGMANPRVRQVLDNTGNQVLIWREIANQLNEDSIPNKTLSYLTRQNSKAFVAGADLYMKYFQQALAESDSNIVGIICVSGDKVIGGDIFTQPTLFFTAVDALLVGYLEAAILKGAKPTLPDTLVKIFTDPFLQSESSQQQVLRKRGKAHYFRNKIMHLVLY
jgi:hypothetical protein